MNTDELKAEFLSARAKTMSTVVNASGWKVGTVNAANVGVESVFMYVFDHQSSWAWCCSVPRDMFELAIQHSRTVSPDDLTSLCDHLIATGAADTAPKQSSENHLAYALASYVSITKTYALTQHATTANHFVVIRYGRTGTLRPFAMRGPARHLLVEQVVAEAIQNVLTMDQKNHPEFFA